jgi:hypothetical protein
MRLKVGRFGAGKPVVVAVETCGCTDLSEGLLRRMAAKIKGTQPPAVEPAVEPDVPSKFDRIGGIPLWLLEAEGWEPGEDPEEYFDFLSDVLPTHDLSPTWFARLEAEYALLDADSGGEP